MIFEATTRHVGDYLRAWEIHLSVQSGPLTVLRVSTIQDSFRGDTSRRYSLLSQYKRYHVRRIEDLISHTLLHYLPLAIFPQWSISAGHVTMVSLAGSIVMSC